MAFENKDALRQELNEEEMLGVTGGGSSEGGDTDYWFEICDQCGRKVKCYPNQSLADHKKKWCPNK